MITIVSLLVIPALVATVRAYVDRLVAELDLAAMTDPLTHLANRRALLSRLDAERARAARTGQPVALVILDLDHFKAVNDRFGHSAGDRALQHVADVLTAACRTVDVAARLGGEEFAVLLPDTSGPAALTVAERLREAIAMTPTADGIRITASFGVAEDADEDDPLAAADEALYRAKDDGRDRCALAQPRHPGRTGPPAEPPVHVGPTPPAPGRCRLI